LTKGEIEFQNTPNAENAFSVLADVLTALAIAFGFFPDHPSKIISLKE
jgi:hypothetical protein